MPNLIETYARSTGLRIDKPWVKQDFWPMPFSRFITLSAGSGQAAKNYSYFQIVVDLLNPILSPLDIHIIQLGDDKTPLLSGTYDLRGKMNIAQSTNLIQRAVCHLGVDSWSAHMAGILNKPLVALYGTTSALIHGPHWQDPARTILLEAHRWGRKPTFGAEGHPKSIDTIRPEEVANAVLKLLAPPDRINRRTQFIGPMFFFSIFDVVPNSLSLPNLALEVPFTVRMDIEFNEPMLLAILQTGRKVTIVTKACVNLQLLAAFRQNILSYNHEIDETCPREFPAQVKSLIPNSVFFSRGKDPETLSRLRFHFFDHCSIEQVAYATRADYIRDSALYLNISEPDAQKRLDSALESGILTVQTNKVILSNGSIYRSYAHLSSSTPSDLNQSSAQGLSVIDSEEFWRDANHFYIYEEETKSQTI